MPFSLESSVLAEWLSGSGESAGAITVATPPMAVDFHRVPREVGNVQSLGEGLIAAVE